jgi:hypothetical protein
MLCEKWVRLALKQLKQQCKISVCYRGSTISTISFSRVMVSELNVASRDCLAQCGHHMLFALHFRQRKQNQSLKFAATKIIDQSQQEATTEIHVEGYMGKSLSGHSGKFR